MQRRRCLMGAAALGLASPAWPARAAPAARPAAPDSTVAAFAAAGLDGRLYRLVDGTPRQRIVNLWARWCAPCRRELPSLQRLAARLDAQRFELLTIALDDEAFALREYARDIGLTLPVLPVALAMLPPALRPTSLPQTLSLATDGRLLARVAGAREWDAPGVADVLWRAGAGAR
jgi:thiol-disulfide isomerase/thioredoxin